MITEQHAKEMFEDMLDETCAMVEIGNLSYEPSQVLKAVDPTAYRIGFDEYVDSLIEDGEIVEGYNDDEEEGEC